FREQPLVDIAHSIERQRVPIQTRYAVDDSLEVLRMREHRGRKRIYLSDVLTLGMTAQIGEHLSVKIEEIGALVANKVPPPISLRQKGFGSVLFCDLEEQKISQFRNIFMVADAITTKDMTQVPYSLDNVFCAHNQPRIQDVVTNPVSPRYAL